MYFTHLNDIKEFPFQEVANVTQAELDLWAQDHNLEVFNSWMLPQMQAYFGSLKVSVDDQGTHNTLALLKDSFNKKNPWALGLWRVSTQLRRSLLVKSQITNAEHSALVPLILSGLKKYQNIPYQSWTADGLEYIVGPQLYEAMMYKPPELTLDELMEIRRIGLSNKTGAKVGQMKKATTTWKLTGIKNTILGNIPDLAGTMLAQIWVAHPSLRNRYMVLDPVNWDNMPRPLIETHVLTQEPTTQKPVDKDDGSIPWE